MSNRKANKGRRATAITKEFVVELTMNQKRTTKTVVAHDEQEAIDSAIISVPGFQTYGDSARVLSLSKGADDARVEFERQGQGRRDSKRVKFQKAVNKNRDKVEAAERGYAPARR